MFEKLNALKAIHAKAMEQLKADGEAALKAALAEFFAAHPEAVAIAWRQYTPYFNDGDACTFSVHEPGVKLASTKEDEGDYEDGFISWNLEEKAPALADDFNALSSLITSDAMEPILQSVFGDHVRIEATAESITVNEYSHD